MSVVQRAEIFPHMNYNSHQLSPIHILTCPSEIPKRNPRRKPDSPFRCETKFHKGVLQPKFSLKYRRGNRQNNGVQQSNRPQPRSGAPSASYHLRIRQGSAQPRRQRQRKRRNQHHTLWRISQREGAYLSISLPSTETD